MNGARGVVEADQADVVARAKTAGAQLMQDAEPEGGVADEQGVGRGSGRAR
jgi:hypothetical protein